MILIVKTITNKEDQAADLIAQRVEKSKLEIYSIVRPHALRGYILIESPDLKTAEEATQKVPYVKRVLQKPVAYEDVEKMLMPVAAEISIEEGDIVEMLTPPFKREQAKVVKVDKAKEEVVVELLEAAIPIPITAKLDSVKVIRKKEKSE